MIQDLYFACTRSKVLPSAGPSTSTAKVGKTHQDDTIETLLEPAHRVLLLDTVLEAHPRLLLLPPRYTRTRTAHDDVEVHAEDTDTGVVAGAEIDVLLDTKAKVARLREVAAAELVLLDLEATLENFLGFGATDGDVDGDLFVTSDTESSDGVASLAYRLHAVRNNRIRRSLARIELTVDRSLTAQLLQDLRSTSQSVTRFTD